MDVRFFKEKFNRWDLKHEWNFLGKEYALAVNEMVVLEKRMDGINGREGILIISEYQISLESQILFFKHSLHLRHIHNMTPTDR